jgi:hypothetical protein
MVRAEKITEGPGGIGTKFRSAVASMGRTAEMLIECTGYDRPRRLASTTTMSQAEISYTLTFEPAGTGTRMRWSGQVRPKGAYKLLGPLISWLGRRQERRIWAGLKHRMEASPAAAVVSEPRNQRVHHPSSEQLAHRPLIARSHYTTIRPGKARVTAAVRLETWSRV